MGSVFEFDSAHRVLLCSFKGRMTDGDLRDFHRDSTAYAQRMNPKAAIKDLSGVTALDITSFTVQQLAIGDPILPEPSRPRFVVAPANEMYGMSRMYQLVGEPTRPRLEIVRTLEEALAAIGVKDPKFEPIEA